MTATVVLQVTSFLEVAPPWLPVAAIAAGHVLLLAGMGIQYLDGTMGHWSVYSPAIGRVSVLLLTASVAMASYITVLEEGLALTFAFLTFMSGRFIQGAISLRLIQKVLDFFTKGTRRDAPAGSRSRSNALGGSVSLQGRLTGFLKSRVRDRVVIVLASGLIVTHTAGSIAAVYFLGDGSTIEAIRRLWVGLFLLTTVGLAFDFRYFVHRLSWVAAFGMVVTTAGSFLYSPVGFSSLTEGLAPYVDNPIPDWMRLPLGSVGFLFGMLFWMIMYSKKN